MGFCSVVRAGDCPSAIREHVQSAAGGHASNAIMKAKHSSRDSCAGPSPVAGHGPVDGARQLFVSLFRQSPISVALSDAANGRFIDVNDAFCKALGYSRAEVIGKTGVELGLYVSTEQRDGIIKELMARGRVSGAESPLRRKDGTTLTCSFSAELIESQGKTLFLGVMNDLTERREAEEKHRVILETAVDGFVIDDLEGRLREANDSYCRMVGYSREELLTMSIRDIDSAEDQEQIAGHMRKLKEQGYERFETRHKCKDGRIIDVEVSAHYVDMEGGQIVAFVRDVSGRKQAERALRESEGKYRTLVEAIPQKIFLKDRNSVYVSCNGIFARDLNIRPEEIRGRTDYDFYPRDLADKYRADDKKIAESGSTEMIEERYIEQGQEKVVETFKTPVRDESGEVVGVLGVFHDITERRQMEEALRRSEERYRLIADNTSDSIWVLGPDLRAKYQSPSGERIFGYALQEWETMGWSDFVHPDYLEAVVNLMRDFRDGREEHSRTITVKVRHKDGRDVWVEISASPVRGQYGEFAGVVGVTRDVTERKEDENRLLLYKTAVEQSAEGIALADMDGRVHFVNEACARMHGWSVEEVRGRHLSVFHTPEQMESEVVPFRLRLLETGFKTGEVGHVRKNGETFPVFMTVTVLKGAGDEPLGLLAIMRDITEEREMERRRRDQELAEARAEELSKSRNRLIMAQESLRKDIAGELHGTVQNRLILLAHKLAELEARPASEMTVQELAGIRHRLEELQSEHVRPISHRLFPSILRMGIVAGLESLVDEYDGQLPIDLRVSKQLRAREQSDRRLVSENTRLAVYRIAEEALANILKHTPAVESVVVGLSLTGGRVLRLTVTDDGPGFAAAGSSDSIGLAMISDYAAAAGGSCVIEGMPGKGTQVRAQVPIAGLAEER